MPPARPTRSGHGASPPGWDIHALALLRPPFSLPASPHLAAEVWPPPGLGKSQGPDPKPCRRRRKRRRMPGSRDGGETNSLPGGIQSAGNAVGDPSPGLPLGSCTLREAPNQLQEVPVSPVGLKNPAEGHLCDPHPRPISTAEPPTCTGGTGGPWLPCTPAHFSPTQRASLTPATPCPSSP